MKVLFYIMDTIAANAAYLHAIGNNLNLEQSEYVKKTFRHAFISSLAMQLIEPQLKLSLHQSTRWEKEHYERIFEAEKQLYEGHLTMVRRREEEEKSAAAQSSYTNPIQKCTFCEYANQVRVVCDKCRKPVCGLHRVKVERNRYLCLKCNRS